MNIIISTSISLIVKWLSDSQLSIPQITRIKNLISDLEGRAIDSVIKHQSAADLVKSFATSLSNTAVDTIVKLLLLAVRANG